MITKGFFRTPSTLDYNGIYRGRYIDYDAKETQNKTSAVSDERKKQKEEILALFESRKKKN